MWASVWNWCTLQQGHHLKRIPFFVFQLSARSHSGQSGLPVATARGRGREQQSVATSVRKWGRWRIALTTIAQVIILKFMILSNFILRWLQGEWVVKLVRVSHAEHRFSLSRLQSAHCKQVLASSNPFSPSMSWFHWIKICLSYFSFSYCSLV